MPHSDSHPAGRGLPADMTRLVGRQNDGDELIRLLASARLITLTGVGGVGKTRLAVDVGRSAEDQFPGGVRFVSCAELNEPELLPLVTSTALGAPPAESADSVAEFIGDRTILLVLDNLEHLSDAAATLIALVLSRCPNLRILATSREALRINGETVFQVQPLGLPDEDEHGPPGWAARYPAVALFVERARALNSSFALTASNEGPIVDLCRRLDGVPLALELAASATHWLPVDVISSMASEPLALPAEASRRAESRHLSLRATLDYSRTLCSAQGQLLWGRMSVFRGGATLEAIERICVDDNLSVPVFRSALAELIEKSVLVFETPRYRMLETVRQYGAELLVAAGAESRVGHAHLTLMADLAAAVSRCWFGDQQQRLFADARAELANIRAALEFALREPGAAPVGLRLATQLWPFWVGCGLPSEGRLWIDRLLALPGVHSDEEGESHWATGYLAAIDGDGDRARGHLEQAMECSIVTGDAALRARTTQALGMVGLFSGNQAEALARYEEGIAFLRAAEPRGAHLVDGLILLGEALCDIGELDRATSMLQEAREICGERREQLLYSWSETFLGLVAYKQGRYEDALRGLRKAVSTQANSANWQGIVWAVEVTAWAELAMGDAAQAARLFGASEAVSAGHGPHLHGARPMLAERGERVQQARDALGDSSFEQFVARGRGLNLGEVVELVCREPERAPADSAHPAELQVLTRREREIAELVATGMTNKDIAAQLVIARRTVDSHVEHILAKLGFSSRAQIAALVASSKPD